MAKYKYTNFSKEDIHFLIHSRLKQKRRDKKNVKFIQLDIFHEPPTTKSKKENGRNNNHG